jgi:hypothetical protein
VLVIIYGIRWIVTKVTVHDLEDGRIACDSRIGNSAISRHARPFQVESLHSHSIALAFSALVQIMTRQIRTRRSSSLAFLMFKAFSSHRSIHDTRMVFLDHVRPFQTVRIELTPPVSYPNAYNPKPIRPSNSRKSPPSTVGFTRQDRISYNGSSPSCHFFLLFRPPRSPGLACRARRTYDRRFRPVELSCRFESDSDR